MLPLRVPRHQLAADLLQRPRAALIERALVLPRLGQQLRGGLLDARRVLRRQLDQRAQVIRSPLQPRRRPFALVEGLLVPAQRLFLATLLAGIAAQRAHQVIRAVALGQAGLEQRVAVAPQAGAPEQEGRRRDHRLTLIAVGDLLVDLGGMRLHLRQQRRGQLGRQLGLGLVQPRQFDPRDQRLQAVGPRQGSVGLEALERRIELRDQRLPVRTRGGRQRADDVVAVVAQHIHLRAGSGRIRQHLLHAGPQRGIRLERAAALGGGQRLEPQPGGRLLIDALARRGQPRQQRGPLRGGHQLLLVGLPGIETQQLPLVGGQLPARLGIGQHRLDGAAAGQAQLQHAQHLRRVDLARQAGELLAVVAEQDHGRITAHLEARAQALGAGVVAVDVDRDEGARLLDEVGAVEQRGLELVARRAPLGAPVQQHRLLLAASLGEGALDVGVAGGLLPRHRGRRARGGRCGHQRRDRADRGQRGGKDGQAGGRAQAPGGRGAESHGGTRGLVSR